MAEQLAPSGWHTYDKSVLKLYCDGVLLSQKTVENCNIKAQDDQLAVGYDVSNNRKLDGEISIARVYTKALTQAEIQAQNKPSPAITANDQNVLLWLDYSDEMQVSSENVWDYYAEDYAKSGMYKNKEMAGKYFGYGGDWGDANNDNNFCVNGLVSPDRDPQPELYEVKYQYQNFWMTATEDDIRNRRVYVFNENNFANLNEYNFEWELLEDGKVIDNGTVDDADLEAKETRIFHIPYEMPAKLKAGAEYYLNLNVSLKEGTWWAEAGHSIAHEQFAVPANVAAVPFTPNKAVTVDETNADYVLVTGSNFSFKLNKTTGAMYDYTVGTGASAKTIISSGPVPQFWRAKLDNDNANVGWDWRHADKNITADRYDVKTLSDGRKEITTVLNLGNANNVKETVVYTVDGSGAVTVKMTVDAKGNGFGRFMKIGSKMTLPKGFETVKWYGNGPVESFSDRNSFAVNGVFEQTVNDLFYPFLKTQSCGTMTGVKWMALENETHDAAVLIATKGVVEAGALHFTVDELDDANHPFEMGAPNEETYVNVDYKSSGNGNASCGPDTLWPYLIYNDKEYSYEYTLLPYNKNSDDPMEVSKPWRVSTTQEQEGKDKQLVDQLEKDINDIFVYSYSQMSQLKALEARLSNLTEVQKGLLGDKYASLQNTLTTALSDAEALEGRIPYFVDQSKNQLNPKIPETAVLKKGDTKFNAVLEGYLDIPNDKGANGKDIFKDVINGSKPFTLEAWVKPLSNHKTYNMLMSKGDNSLGLRIGNFKEGQSLELFIKGTDGKWSTVSSSIPAGTVLEGSWHQVAGTYNGSQLSIYLDGKHLLSIDKTGNGLVNSTSTLFSIGYDSETGRDNENQFSAVRVYKTALTKEQIQKQYDAQTSGTSYAVEKDNDSVVMWLDMNRFAHSGGSDNNVERYIPRWKYTFDTDDSHPQNGNEGPIAFAFDGNEETYWHTNWNNKIPVSNDPKEVDIELNQATEVNGFAYLPRQWSNYWDHNGTVTSYELYVKAEGQTEYTKVADGNWYNNKQLKVINFPKQVVKSVRFVVTDGIGDYASAAEMNLLAPIAEPAIKPVLSFQVISDTHVQNSSYDDNNKDYINNKYLDDSKAVLFKKVLDDIKLYDENSSGLTVLGDFTSDGKAEQVKAFYQMLKENPEVANNNYLIALGNHDARGNNWADGAYWNTIRPLYMQYNAPYRDNADTTYFSKEINGYQFIVMNTENSLKDKTYISEKQLTWLENKLKENASTGKPVFIFNHQALNDTHKNSDEYGGFGEQSDAVKAILKKYPNVIFISGHIHNSFDTSSVLHREYGTLIDVPSVSYNSFGDLPVGCGYHVNVFEDKIEFKARNFAVSTWMPQYDITISLKTLPAIYGECKAKNKDDYTSDSWNAVEAAMHKAEEIFALRYEPNIGDEFKPIYTKETINKIHQEIIPQLKSALDGLVPAQPQPVDKSELQSKLAEAKGKLTGNYTEASLKNLADRIKQAEAVLADEDATAEEVSTAVTNLDNAIKALVPVQPESVDKSALQSKLAEAKGKLTGNYTEASLKNLADSIKQAQAVMADEDATAEEVATAVTNLDNAIKALVPVQPEPVDKSALQSKLAEAKGKLTGNYTEASLKNLADSMKQAEAVLADEDATAQEVATAVTNLDNAIKALATVQPEPVDKSKLQSKLSEAKDKLTGNYTQATLKNLENAVKDAEKVLADAKATEKDVAKAVAMLNDAINKLRIKESSSGSGKSGKNEISNFTEGSNIGDKLTSSKEVTLNTSNNYQVGTSFLTKLMDQADKSVTLNGGWYQWIFKAENVQNDMPGIVYFDTRIAVDENNAEIAKLTNGVDTTTLHFNYEGDLPGKTIIRVQQEKYANKTVYVYYHNPAKNRLELIASNVKADEKGWLQFIITHCSDYVISEKPITGAVADTVSVKNNNSNANLTNPETGGEKIAESFAPETSGLMNSTAPKLIQPENASMSNTHSSSTIVWVTVGVLAVAGMAITYLAKRKKAGK
ncbi:concanavalin A-like lectin/glucanase superfamily protein [Hydrogenoanaerobacterium saccharovorans]|uniref:beta-galactosidase n=1 Tax=Hydrogenoanaerobacterium saccharovorans TaxID=474960 RepID=A0A1H8ECZ7_9FIRM|nr:LamG-like jellyroll fold domain-containing protein [Hydrogenoanaerobacterium saccharovorans]RPF42026.1 concanavalin A-like lectin/glucanase superfamily protein [Hydrogenoanaerobacterium saccharovorans]SEN17286.1 Concanavalin A-like lectin/glucanases superfamily protein [Hydrogenoanaerobacterium saccharovorans]